MDIFLLEQIVIEFPDFREYILRESQLPLDSASSDSSPCFYEYAALVPVHRPRTTEVFRWFRSVISCCNPKRPEPAIWQMIREFVKWRDDFSTSLKEYVLLDGILETCFQHQVDDNELVVQALDLCYSTFTSFGSLHFKGILRPTRVSKRPATGKKPLDYISYFLEHGRRRRLQYSHTRMIDLSVYRSLRKEPVFVAADVWSYRSLLKYLQHGARFEDVPVDPTRAWHGVFLSHLEALQNMTRHLWHRLVSPARDLELSRDQDYRDYCRTLDRDSLELCRCFALVLRAVRSVARGSLCFVITDYLAGESTVRVASGEVLRHETVKIMIPTVERRYGVPVELQHACRWTIRKRLNENWQLPRGIWKLNIPLESKRYLNLQCG